MFNRHIAIDPGMSCLERLSEFLYQDAEYAINGGFFNFDMTTMTYRNNDRDINNVPRRQGRAQDAAAGFVESV